MHGMSVCFIYAPMFSRHIMGYYNNCATETAYFYSDIYVAVLLLVYMFLCTVSYYDHMTLVFVY